MRTHHGAVWIDHHLAHVLFLHEEDAKFEERVVRSHGAPREHGHQGSGHRSAIDTKFFDEVAATLADVDHVFVAGPGDAKDQFLSHLQAKHRAVGEKVLRTESADHPTSGQLAKLAREWFQSHDRMAATPRVR